MAKLDGMDPKLVRELLSEIQHAASQMGGIEAQITQLTRTAGVSVQVTYRPSQIADSCTSMVKDVTKRVALLEKKEKQQGTGKVPTGKAPTASSASYSEEPDITVLPDDSAPSKPGAHDGKDGTKPDHKADHKTGEHTADAKADGHKTDGKAEHKPDANGDGKADAKHDGKVEVKPDGRGDANVDGKADAKHGGKSEGGAIHDRRDASRASGHDSGGSATTEKGGSSHRPHTTADDATRAKGDGGGHGVAEGKLAAQPRGAAEGSLAQMPSPAHDAAHASGDGGTGPGTATGAGGGTAQGTGSGTAQGAGSGTAQGTGSAYGVGGTGDAGANGGSIQTYPPTDQPQPVVNGQGVGQDQGVSHAQPVGLGVGQDGGQAQPVGAGQSVSQDQGVGHAQPAGSGVSQDQVPGQGTPVDSNAAGEQPSVGGNDSQIYDTPGKDHPDDIDPAGRHVSVVDGVKVVSTPLNQPGAESIQGLNGNVQGAQPMDVPSVDVRTVSETGAHPDGPPGLVPPAEPTNPAANQPPQPGLAPGDPMGAYVGTPADDLSREPVATGSPQAAQDTAIGQGAVTASAAGQPYTGDTVVGGTTITPAHPAGTTDMTPAAPAGTGVAHPAGTADASVTSVGTNAATGTAHPTGTTGATGAPAAAPAPGGTGTATGGLPAVDTTGTASGTLHSVATSSTGTGHPAGTAGTVTGSLHPADTAAGHSQAAATTAGHGQAAGTAGATSGTAGTHDTGRAPAADPRSPAAARFAGTHPYPAHHFDRGAVPHWPAEHHRHHEPPAMPWEGDRGDGGRVARKIEPDGSADHPEVVDVIIRNPEK